MDSSIEDIHPAWVRVAHWIDALTRGSWLGGALLWHFAALWVPTKLGFRSPKHIQAIFVTDTYPDEEVSPTGDTACASHGSSSITGSL